LCSTVCIVTLRLPLVLCIGGSVKLKVATSLLVLGWCGSVEKAAEKLGIGARTAAQYLRQFVGALLKRYKEAVIALPIGKELQRLMVASRAWNPPLPGAVLFMDGSYVPFSPPAASAPDYVNHYKYKAIQWQICCDERKRVRDITTGKLHSLVMHVVSLTDMHAAL